MVQPPALALILVAAALAVTGARMAWLLSNLNMNVAAFTAQVIKLLMAGNPARALKLCAAMPRLPLSIGVRAMLEAVDSVGDDEQRRKVLGEVWLKQVLGLRPGLRRFHQATQVGLGMAGGGLVVGIMGGGLHPMILGPAVASAVVVAATEFKVRQVEAETLGAWEMVLDFMEKGLREQVIATYEAGAASKNP